MPTEMEVKQLEAHIAGAGAASVQHQVVMEHREWLASGDAQKGHAESKALAVEHEKETAAQLEAMKHPPGWTPPAEIAAEIAEDIKEEAVSAEAQLKAALGQ